MAFYLAHAGSKLQKVTVAGDVSDLTLPSGVTMSTTRASQFQVLNSSVLVSTGPSINLRVDPTNLAVTPLSIVTPSSVPTVAAGASGVLTGVYYYKVSYAQKSGTTVISESGLSSSSASLTLTAQKGSLSALPTSADASVTARRLYRTVSGGSVFFHLADIDNNTATTYTDDTADAGLDTVAAATDLGNPAGSTSGDYLTLIQAWKDRLWAVGSGVLDLVYYSGINRWFAWSASNYLTINPRGQGSTGVTAFLPRRDELGVAKRRGLWKIVGASTDSYAVIQVINSVGVVAPKSVVIIRDVAYFLAEDGVYAWGADGLRLLSSGRVQSWFTTDTYFNRSLFPDAFGVWNQQDDTYELHLAGVGSGTVNRWVSFHLSRETWLGPHKTDAFTPSTAQVLEDIYGLGMLVRASTAGYLYRANDAIFLDGATAIDLSVTTGWLNGGAPTLEKYFGELTVVSSVEASGTLTVTPKVGTLAASDQATISHDMTVSRRRHRRLGVGQMAQLTFSQNTASVGGGVYGYEIDPVSVVGRR